MKVACLCLALAVGASAVMTDAACAADPSVAIQRLDDFDLAVEPTAVQDVTTLSDAPDGTVLDQFFIGSGNFGSSVRECCPRICQTFTAGLTGLMVGVNIDVRSNDPYPLWVFVRRVFNGGWPSEIATSVTLPTSSSPLSSFVALEPPVQVFAGAQYAICIEYPATPPLDVGQVVGTWRGTVGNPYVRGDSFSFKWGEGWRHGIADLHFRTYVRTNEAPDCSAARASIETLWPPDRRLVPVRIDGIVDPDGDPVSVTVTGVTQDEPVDEGGMFCPDAEITETGLNLRAERLGSSNGRVYTTTFIAEDGNGGECSGSVEVCVPHDRGHAAACIDDGGVFDALTQCGTAQSAAELPRARIHPLAVPESPPTLEYSLPQAAAIRLSVYDVSGRRVRVLDDGWRPAGTHRVRWHAGTLARGIYFYRLEASGVSVSSRFVIL